MKKKRNIFKTVAVVSLSLIVIIVGVSIYANHLVYELVETKLKSQLEDDMGVRLTHGKISVNFWFGDAEIQDLRFSAPFTSNLKSGTIKFDVKVKTLRLHYFQLWKILTQHELYITRIDVVDPNGAFFIKEHFKEKNVIKEVQEKSFDQFLKFVNSMGVNNLKVENASVSVKSVSSHLAVACDSLYLDANNFVYDFIDTVFTYNDTIYALSFSNFKLIEPDSLFTLTIDEFNIKEDSHLTLEDVHYTCNVAPDRLSDLRGEVQSTWLNLHLKRVYSNSCNIARTFSTGQLYVDSLYILSDRIHLYRDARYELEEEEIPIQRMLMKQENPLFLVNHIALEVPSLMLQLVVKDNAVGAVEMKSLRASIDKFQNTQGSINCFDVKGAIANQGGTVDMDLRLYFDEACSFDCSFVIKDAEMSALDSLLLPMYGCCLDGHISSIATSYSGDSSRAEGVFCMRYENMAAELFKDRVPYKELAKHCKTINGIQKMILSTDNPHKHHKLRVYKVESRRDLDNPYFMHFMLPMMKGMKYTVLPFFYAGERVDSTALAAMKIASCSAGEHSISK